MKIHPIGVDNLRCAIVQQACEDYQNAVFNRYYYDYERNLPSLKSFFLSDWFEDLVRGKIDAKRLMRDLEMQEIDKWINVYENVLMVDRVRNIDLSWQKRKHFDEKGGKYRLPTVLRDSVFEYMKEQLEELKKLKKELYDGDIESVSEVLE
jgi:hypothetical protein